MFIDVISTGSNTLLLVKGQTEKGCCLLFLPEKSMVGICALYGYVKGVMYCELGWIGMCLKKRLAKGQQA